MNMSVDDFLDNNPVGEEETGKQSVDDFLKGVPVEKKESPKPRKAEENKWYQAPVDIGAGFNDTLLNTLDLPNDAFNWAAEKLGIDVKAPSTRTLGSKIRIGYPEGEEPDTGSYMAGKVTATGLEFLAPILKVGSAVKTGASIATIANPSVSRGVAQKMTQPFLNAPKTAYSGEIAGGILSGYGMHEGRERFGWQGEQAFGLIGGLAPQTAFTLAPKMQNSFMRSVFPMTPAGSKPKARQIIESLSETGDIAGDIKANKSGILKKALISPARKSDDPDLMALEKVLIDEDPELANTFRLLEEKNNSVAREALEKMRGDESVQDAQLFLTGKYAKLANRLNAFLDIKVQKAQDAITDIDPKTRRSTANTMVREAIDTSLTAARKDEDVIWKAVPVTEKAETENIVNTFSGLLKERYKSDDPAEIMPFIYKFLGNFDEKGMYKKGVFSDVESVGELHAFRKRLLKEIRVEKKIDAPDWNKVRIMDDIQESVLDSLSNSGASNEIKDAIAFSRTLNKRFKGGILNVILGSDIHGGKLSPTLTMESVGLGARGAENIRKILAAAPDSIDSVEQVLKLEMAYKLVSPTTGRLKSLDAAKKHMMNNDEVMDIFPKLKGQMENAIALEEQAKWYSGVVKARMDKAKQSPSYKISKSAPKRVITTILESKNPSDAMSKELGRLNKVGIAGIRNDIIDTLIAKSEKSNITDSMQYVLSGDKMAGYWNKNMKTLSKPFNGKEVKRINKIINTLRLSEGRKDLPTFRAKKALEATHGMVEYIVTLAATRGGAKLGAGSSGASLKTASEASKRAKALLGELDVGGAKRLLKDAILDEDLYIAITEDTTKFTPLGKNWRVIQGWMVANAVESMKETEE